MVSFNQWPVSFQPLDEANLAELKVVLKGFLQKGETIKLETKVRFHSLHDPISVQITFQPLTFTFCVWKVNVISLEILSNIFDSVISTHFLLAVWSFDPGRHDCQCRRKICGHVHQNKDPEADQGYDGDLSPVDFMLEMWPSEEMLTNWNSYLSKHCGCFINPVFCA